MGKSGGSETPPGNGKNGHRPKNGHTHGRPAGIGDGATKSGTGAGVVQQADFTDVDQYYAELDRGWDYLEAGSLDEARQVGETLVQAQPDVAEGYVLLGMLDGIAGDPEEALARYQRALELDPELVDALIGAAELYIWEFGEHEKALELCERALDLAEEEDEYVDALLLKADAEVQLGHDRAAYATLCELPELALPDPSYHLRAARLLLDLEKTADAERHYRFVLEEEPDHVDALHGIGLCAEQRGDRAAMIESFQRVRAIDLKEPSPPWAVSSERFAELCEAALEHLPERLRKLLGNVPIIAEDYPSEELVADGSDPRMLGLFAGVPYGDKSSIGGAPQLDTIFLYQRNIERMAYSAEDVEEEVHITLVHEAGHFFGLSDEQLEEMGLG